jgi:hypothetical protein
MEGLGLTLTVTVKLVPVHGVGDAGVTVYVAVCTVLVGLISVPEINVCPVPETPPVTPPVTTGADQL